MNTAWPPVGRTIGTPFLDEETAKTWTAGVVLRPSFIPGLVATFDWYDIKITDAIASQSPAQIMSLCAVRGGVYCDLITRDASTGAVLYECASTEA